MRFRSAPPFMKCFGAWVFTVNAERSQENGQLQAVGSAAVLLSTKTGAFLSVNRLRLCGKIAPGKHDPPRSLRIFTKESSPRFSGRLQLPHLTDTLFAYGK